MLLVVDVGNTETVIGVYKQDELKTHWSLSSRVPRTSDESWILLKTWCEAHHIAFTDIRGFVVSSVVPSLTAVFAGVSRERFGLEPLVITADTDTGLEILYDTPRTVGADRICNAVAGYAMAGGPLIVVDFGTATTFDVISEKGAYIGGSIALGLKGASEELHRVAAKLPRVDLVFPGSVVGRTTEESIQSGIMWGTLALVDGMIDTIAREMEWDTVQVIATGGTASSVVEKSARIERVEPFLTLEGMRLIYQRNQKSYS